LIYVYRVSGTAYFTSRVQVEDVKLSRKVLYCFAVDSIVNDILIFEYRWMRAYSPGPPPNASARRCTSAPLNDTASFVHSRHSHCRSKQLRARLETWEKKCLASKTFIEPSFLFLHMFWSTGQQDHAASIKIRDNLKEHNLVNTRRVVRFLMKCRYLYLLL